MVALRICLHELFEAQAARTPHAPALVFEGETLTYRELDRRASRVAAQLAALGVGPDVTVGLHVERSLELVVGMLGILKAGGAYVPIDPSYPAERVDFMVSDSGARVVLDRAFDWHGTERTEPFAADVKPHHLAYVIYTSGSTGKPKGVGIEHRNIVNYVLGVIERLRLEAGMSYATVSTVAADLGNTVIFPALASGGCLHVISQERARNGALLAEYFAREKIDVLKIVPSHFAALNPAGVMPRKRLILGGEASRLDWIEGLRMLAPRIAPDLEIFNHYGPTETTVGVLTYRVDGQPAATQSGTLPLGKPLPGTKVELVDGEICISGAGVARGYLNRPELTAQKFAGGVYRTGDRGRLLPDGSIEFCGRIDHQVKVNGYRVELGEIEAALRSHEAVEEAVVLLREDQLVAFVAPREADQATLREHLGTRLPPYMVPSNFVRMEKLPLTANGKIDRQALAALPLESAGPGPDFVAPRSGTERALAGIWSELLKIEYLGINDDVFDLGAHSLMAMKALTRIRDVFGVNLSLRNLFESPSVAALAEAIDGQPAPAATQVARIPPRPDLDTAPLSSAQRQMWVIDQLTPGNAAYNMSLGYRLRGPLQPAALEASFNEVIKRHATLRTTFAVQDGEALQRIHPQLRIAIELIALDHLSVEERETRLRILISDESARPFDLTRAPLIRVSLFKLGNAEHVMLIVVHHIAIDGLSFALLLNELDKFYGASTRGGAPRLPALAVQYADFAAWQQRALADESAYAGQIEFWRKELGGTLPVSELPADKPRPAFQSFKGANVFFSIPAALAQELRALGAREGCTVFMTLLAAFQVLLHRYSGAADLVIGTPVSARTPPEVEPLIGNFLNMAALRCDLAGDPSFIQLLRRSRDAALNAFSNSDLPFGALLKHLKFERDPSRNPIFQVLLEVLPWTTENIGGLEVSAVQVDPKLAQFDLGLHVDEGQGDWVGRFEYCTDLFHAETIERLSANFVELLRAIARDPRQLISRMPMLTASERHRMLEEWNSTGADLADVPVHRLLEAQADRTPQRTALVVKEALLSYAALDARANRLAHVLRSRGIGRGQRVGVCVKRSAEMLAALLGILKSGAAYVPLDPAFPEARLRLMAEDAQMALVLSTADLAGSVGLPRERQLLLDADAQIIAGAPDTRLPVDARADSYAARPEDPAYVIYTSGSTGKPKGVVVPHRAVVNFLASMAREPGLVADDVLVAVTTLSFDIAVLELQLPLAVGATIVLATRDEAMDGSALRALLERQQASVMQATPVTWRLLLEAGWRGRPGRAPFKVLVGGEALPALLADQLVATGAEVWNMYGPTETTVWSTCARITGSANGITVGRPIANTVVRILDSRNDLCPIGVAGELCIGGTGVALGYWNRPELTAEKFVADPFSPAGAPLYRSGDRARWRSDGTLEHLGRLDYQVKLRGFRIEVGEIEIAIARHPAVREVAVVAREDARGEQCLVAYVVSEQAPADLPDQLRALLRTTLPEYMIPAHVIALDALPRTLNGKLDRKALPAPIGETQARRGMAAAPRTATEAMVLDAFRQVLAGVDVGVLDNFFDLGGNSLLAARLMARLRTVSGFDLPLRVLFERQTVAALAEAIDALALLAAARPPHAATGEQMEEIAL
jgi:amino acid adenylation domain-containing protein